MALTDFDVSIGTAVLLDTGKPMLFLTVPFAYGRTRVFKCLRVHRNGTPKPPGRSWEIRQDGHCCTITGIYILTNGKGKEVFRTRYEWTVEHETAKTIERASKLVHELNLTL